MGISQNPENAKKELLLPLFPDLAAQPYSNQQGSSLEFLEAERGSPSGDESKSLFCPGLSAERCALMSGRWA